MMRINVVHAVPYSASANGVLEDGFTVAMAEVGRRHEVRWLNIHPHNADAGVQESLIPDADLVLVRSDWGWLPVQSTDRALRGLTTPVVLLIAGSSLPPPRRRMLRFDALLYETPWYARHVADHPFAVQAFGVDTAVMRDLGRPDRAYDWLMVGRLASFKRPERLLEKSGRRVAIGDLSAARPEIEDRLRADGVELLDQQGQAPLADLYNDARRVLVPCELNGGGERAVLEARACGCEVEIAPDNPKLASLLTCEIWSAEDYADRILDVVEGVDGGRRVPDADKLRGQAAHRRWVLRDKLRRAPATLRIRIGNLPALRRLRGAP